MNDCKGGVVNASSNHITFGNGTVIRTDDRVGLPDVAGGGTGIVDQITMVFIEQEDRLEFVIRVVDDKDQGHMFIFKEEEYH
jgi:hypothetical protein